MPKAPARRLSLRPADPFDLIRWLARSQSDPRKAVAELVQNSIDARAHNIAIERRRLRGNPALVVRDDGEGVLPELGREDALRFIATNIGSSQKRKLSPDERRRLVVTGQYGVGLLGFWSIGHRMEIRSRVGDSGLHVLRLVEDEPEVALDEIPVDIDAAPTFTEIVVTEMHDTASRALTGRRLAEYLAAELRGPILASGAKVEIRDAMARGLAQKRFPVAPRPFTGERLEIPAELPVGGHPPVRVELYLARGAERPAIQVSCAGTLVADDIAELQALDLAEPPWVGRELAGLVEFPGFTVPPGSRRGVAPTAPPRRLPAPWRRSGPWSRLSCAAWSGNGARPPTARSSRSSGVPSGACAPGCRSTTCRRCSADGARRVLVSAGSRGRRRTAPSSLPWRSPRSSPAAPWPR